MISRELTTAIEEDGAVVALVPHPAIGPLRQQQQLICSLSTKLRITPQSRVTKRQAARATEDVRPSAAELYDRASH